MEEIMDKCVRYGHARNSHPAPPITIKVENGTIISFKINKKAINTYTGGDIADLFEAAGIGRGQILRPIPERFMHVALSALRISLLPGEYTVIHRAGDMIELPESAFRYWVENEGW